MISRQEIKSEINAQKEGMFSRALGGAQAEEYFKRDAPNFSNPTVRMVVTNAGTANYTSAASLLKK